MFRKFFAIAMVFSLCFTTVACGGTTSKTSSQQNYNTSVNRTQPSDGKYPVRQVSFNDATGEYSMFLLDASPSNFTTSDVKMAALTKEEVTAGEKSYLKVESGEPTLHLSEDYKIEYVHAVTETQTNPQTGQPQTVVVRQQSSFWTPFAGALAGQVVGNLLFTPRYYVPPVYQPGIMTGYGGYGNTYGQAVQHYQSRYQAPPAVEQNRRAQLRTTGRIGSNQTTTSPNRPRVSPSGRPSGSGAGSSRLRPSGQSSPSRVRPGSGSFGSGGRSRPAAPRRSGSFRRR